MNSVGKLTPQNAALIVIDVQQRLMSAMPKRDITIAGVDRLIRAAKILSVPSIITLQYIKGLGPLCDELLESTRELPVFEKMAFSCCGDAKFSESFAKLNRPRAILCGVEAHVCVQQTALDLIASGKIVYIAADAVCSRKELDESIALKRLRHAGAIVTTVESIVFELLGEAGTAVFKQVLPLFK